MKHCRCGHSPILHASKRYACVIRFNRWPMRGMRGETVANRSCDCQRYREARWLDDHSPWRHLAVRLWWRTPERLAYWIINHWPIPGRCWCDLFDSVEPIRDRRKREDYTRAFSCLCDAPLPTDAGVPDGRCYCPTPNT